MGTGTKVAVLTFPDGREVRTLTDLSEWEQMVYDDETCPEEEKQFAWIMANRIRAKFN